MRGTYNPGSDSTALVVPKTEIAPREEPRLIARVTYEGTRNVYSTSPIAAIARFEHSRVSMEAKIIWDYSLVLASTGKLSVSGAYHETWTFDQHTTAEGFRTLLLGLQTGREDPLLAFKDMAQTAKAGIER